MNTWYPQTSTEKEKTGFKLQIARPIPDNAGMGGGVSPGRHRASTAAAPVCRGATRTPPRDLRAKTAPNRGSLYGSDSREAFVHQLLHGPKATPQATGHGTVRHFLWRGRSVCMRASIHQEDASSRLHDASKKAPVGARDASRDPAQPDRPCKSYKQASQCMVSNAPCGFADDCASLAVSEGDLLPGVWRGPARGLPTPPEWCVVAGSACVRALLALPWCGGCVKS